MTGANAIGEELKLRLQKHVGIIILSWDCLLGAQQSPWNQTGAQLRMALGVFLTNKPFLSRKEESTKYFNFSTSDEKNKKEAEHCYRVRSRECPYLPSTVLLMLGAGGRENEELRAISRNEVVFWILLGAQ